MLTLDQLSQQISDYQQGRMSVDDFEDWFRDESRGAYRGSTRIVSAAIVAVEAALSKHHFGNLNEGALKQELVNAICPFEQTSGVAEKVIRFAVGVSSFSTSATTKRLDFEAVCA